MMAAMKDNVTVLPLHTESLCKYLNVMRQDGKFCDIHLVCKEKKFMAHKNILAANSEHFVHVLSNGAGVENISSISLEIEPRIMEILLDFIYTGKARMGQETVEEVMRAANELKLVTIFSHCRSALLDHLDVGNFYRIWCLGDGFDDELLKKRAVSFAAKNFGRIIQEGEFLKLSLLQLKQLLGHENTKSMPQDKVLESIIQWVKHMKSERSKLLSTLLTYVKFEHLSKPYLQILVDQEEIVWESPELMRHITKTVFARYMQSDDHVHSPTDGSSSLETVEEVETEMAIAMFGENEEKHIICQCYGIEQKEWYPPEELPLQMTNASVVIYKQTIFLIGGKQGNSYLRSIYHYAVNTGELWEGQNMHVARSHAGVAECHGRVYVIGGYNSSGFLSSVECYNPSENEWRQMAPLNEGRGGMAVTSVSRFLYVVGGRTSSSVSPLNNVDCYDTFHNQWTKVTPLPQARSHCGVTVLMQKIYVVGGYIKDGTACESMLSFNPLTKEWQEVNPPPTDDWVTDAVTWDNYMYVITDAGQIFRFDSIKKLWTNCSFGPPDSAYYTAAVLISKPIWDA